MNSILKLLAEFWQWSNKVKKQISSHAIRMINCPLTSFCNAWPVNCPRMHILCNESLVFRWRNNRLGIIPASSGYYYVLCAWTEEQWCVTSWRWLTDQMCVVFPCLGADWRSVKTGTTLEWVNVADGECPWKFYEWILYRHLYMTKIFFIIQCGNENLLVQVWHSSLLSWQKISMKLAILSLSLSLTQYNITFFCLNSKTLCCDYLQCFN